MSIKVTCPNGHELQVKNEFAGKTGVCPTCKARIVVPVPEPKAVSEDDLLAVLGTPRFVPRVPVSDEPAPRHSPVAAQGAEAKKEAVAAGSAIGTSGGAPRETAAKKEAVAPAASALLRRKKVCPICCDIISVGHSECPLCQTSLSEWTFPLPEEHPAHETARASCHFLGLRKQSGAIVVRFGEHQILDELTVKKFADELFHVSDRPDCQNLLLNFTGVVGLSSAMLGVMLMLRRKMTKKPGKLKLCQVGPEIREVFDTTKLGQLFEIHDNEQQALKAFA